MDSGGDTSRCETFEASIVPVCSQRHSGSTKKRKSPLTGGSKCTLYYNPLLDKNNYSYLTTPSVMQHLKNQGMVASVSSFHCKIFNVASHACSLQDGTLVRSSTEEHKMEQVRRHINEQKEIAKKVKARQEARLERLQKATKANELVYTRDGVYEMDHCRRPILEKFTRNDRGELVRTRRSSIKMKKKKKKHFHCEKVKFLDS